MHVLVGHFGSSPSYLLLICRNDQNPSFFFFKKRNIFSFLWLSLFSSVLIESSETTKKGGICSVDRNTTQRLRKNDALFSPLACFKALVKPVSNSLTQRAHVTPLIRNER